MIAAMSKTTTAVRSPRAAAATATTSAAVAEVKAKTLRLAPEYEAGLALLKGVLGVPVNKMVNEAVAEYIRKRTAEVEADLTGVLDRVKAYRCADPHFKQALAKFVDAEARQGQRDPVEGVVAERAPPAALRRKAKQRTAQSMIRDIGKAGTR